MNGTTTLPRGVRRTPEGRFRAEVTINRKRYSCGTHDDPITAGAAVLARRQATPKAKRPKGERRCARCKRKRPRCGWSSNYSWCRECARADGLARQQTPEYRAWRAEYRGRTEVKERERELARVREQAPERKAYLEAYRSTTRARLVKNRGECLRRAALATDPARIARLNELAEGYGDVLARLDRRLNPPDEQEVA